MPVAVVFAPVVVGADAWVRQSARSVENAQPYPAEASRLFLTRRLGIAGGAGDGRGACVGLESFGILKPDRSSWISASSRPAAQPWEAGDNPPSGCWLKASERLLPYQAELP